MDFGQWVNMKNHPDPAISRSSFRTKEEQLEAMGYNAIYVASMLQMVLVIFRNSKMQDCRAIIVEAFRMSKFMERVGALRQGVHYGQAEVEVILQFVKEIEIMSG